MAKLLFLDIDGVTATNQTYNVWRKAGKPNTFAGYVSLHDPTKIALVNSICEATGASIVISSDWKHLDTCSFGVDLVLQAAGLTAPIVGHTPCHCRTVGGGWGPTETISGNRGEEIAAYITMNGLALTDIAIVDDSHYVTRTNRHQKQALSLGSRFIQTNEALGLLPKHVARLIKLLS